MNDVDARVQAAFARVARERFLPRRQRRHAREERPLPIGYDQTNSQPKTVRAMLVELDPRPGDRVLDVGCGSGWTSALLGQLVGTKGWVLGLEIVPELAELARRNVAATAGPHVTISRADPAVLGAPQEAPFDRILVSAEARSMPDPLISQLGPRGRLVVPVRGELTVVERDQEGEVDVRRLGRYTFVPLLWDPP